MWTSARATFISGKETVYVCVCVFVCAAVATRKCIVLIFLEIFARLYMTRRDDRPLCPERGEWVMCGKKSTRMESETAKLEKAVKLAVYRVSVSRWRAGESNGIPAANRKFTWSQVVEWVRTGSEKVYGSVPGPGIM